MDRIPPELTCIIIDYLRADKSSLRTCSLVCRQWTATAQLHLFHDIRILSEYLWSRLVSLLASSPHIGRYIREITTSDIPHEEAIRHLVNLNKLVLFHSHMKNLQDLVESLSRFTSLLELTLLGCHIGVMKLNAVTLPHIIHTFSIIDPLFQLDEFMTTTVSSGMFGGVRSFTCVGRFGITRFKESVGVCILMNAYPSSLVHLELSVPLWVCQEGQFTAHAQG